MSSAAPAPPRVSTTFADFYFRPNLAANNVIPATGPYITCPDIIPWGTDTLADYQKVLATPDSYATSYGNQITETFTNYLYVRGKNGGSNAVTRQISLYYAPSAIIQWPYLWVQNQLLTDSGAKTSLVSNVAPGAIAVAPDTFEWPNVSPPPAGSDHYCLFSYSTDPENPQPVPGSQSMTYEDMAALIQNQLNIGWLNTVLVDRDAPTWVYSQTLSIPADVDGARDVHVYLQCSGFEGAAVSFTGSNQNGASGPIQIPKTTIPDDDYIVGTTVTLQPGFSCSVAVNFWQQDAAPKSGATISLEAAYDTPPGDVEAVQRLRSRGLLQDDYVAALQSGQGLTPSSPVYLGRMKFQAR